MPRGIDRSPASTLLGLAPLALTAWIGKSWTRLPRAQGNGVVLVVLISFFLCLAWLASAVSRGGKNFWSLSSPATQWRGSHRVARRENRENIANIRQRHVLCLPHCDKNDGADEVKF